MMGRSAAHCSLPFFALILGLCLFVLPSIADDSCSADSPCAEGCCGPYGHCGYGPAFCGAGNCTGTCDALAECGPYAAPGQETCPLNVCCDQYYFCGTSSDFCDADKCVSNCGSPDRPTCGTSSGSSQTKTIGYYESWSYNKPGSCAWAPENLNPNLLTHLNFAFAIVGADNQIASMNSHDPDLYKRATALKTINPSLKVFISVGGWDAGAVAFSKMASSANSRATFISSLVAFMDMYAFDGVDIDWEYPAADDRGGVPEDKENYVSLIKELREGLTWNKGITITIPSSFWYMQHFDLAGLQPYLDWFNLMSYDIHGTWDGDSQWTSPVVQPHTNLTEIDDALDLLWRVGVSGSQVVMGLGFYGRSFTLSYGSCNEPMCPSIGGGDPGQCTGTAGILSYNEISQIVAAGEANPVLDEKAGVKYMSWNGNQWVAYDDPDTLKLKRDFANNRCLGGMMIWALDLDTPDAELLRALTGSESIWSNPAWPYSSRAVEANREVVTQNQAALVTYLTDCGVTQCAPGFKRLTVKAGVWSYADTVLEECGPENYEAHASRALCVESDVEVEGCSWVGLPMMCSDGCPKGSIQLAQNNHPDIAGTGFIQPDTPRECFPGRYASYCCRAVRLQAPLQRCDVSDFGNNIVHGGMVGGLTLQGKDTVIQDRAILLGGGSPFDTGACATDPSKCNAGGPTSPQGSVTPSPTTSTETGTPGAIPTYTGTLSLRPGIIPRGIPGVYLSWEECQYLRGSYNGLIYGSGGLPWQAPSWWEFDGTSGYDLVWPGGDPDDDGGTSTSTTCVVTMRDSSTTTITQTTAKGCDADAIPQACMNYRSIARNLAAYGLNPGRRDELYCPYVNPNLVGLPRYAPSLWNNQHTQGWRQWVPQRQIDPRFGCQRDEYPFYRFLGAPNSDILQFIRFNPGGENQAGGRIASGVCSPVMPSHTSAETWSLTVDGTCFETTHTTKTQIVLTVTYDNWEDRFDQDPYDYAVDLNPCTPNIIQEPGFALFTNDPWYLTGSGRPGPPYDYKGPVPAALTQGLTPPTRRSGFEPFLGDANFVIIDDAEKNSSRRANDQDLFEKFGILRCRSASCVEEKRALGMSVDDLGRQTVPQADAVPTQDATQPEVTGLVTRGTRDGKPSFAEPTHFVEEKKTAPWQTRTKY